MRACFFCVLIIALTIECFELLSDLHASWNAPVEVAAVHGAALDALPPQRRTRHKRVCDLRGHISQAPMPSTSRSLGALGLNPRALGRACNSRERGNASP